MDVVKSFRISGFTFCGLIFFLVNTSAQPAPTLEFAEGKVVAKNIDKEALYTFNRYYNSNSDWKSVFPVMTSDSDEENAIDGEYIVSETSVSFTPRFAFAKGMKYKAIFHLEQLTKNFNEIYQLRNEASDLTLTFTSEALSKIQPKVTEVYPTANILPENNLKFHVAFNVSMTTGEVYRRVKILDETGKEIKKAFLVVDQELWDDEMKVITILLDPGRIKRGLKPNLEMGAPLIKEKKYSLVVLKGWKSIDGNYTDSDFTKNFTCGKADREEIKIKKWDLDTPSSPKEPLVINAKEPLNFVMAGSAIRITDLQNNVIKGRAELIDHQTKIIFYPEQEWLTADYKIEVNPLLEDLAGNNLRRVFDRDLSNDKSDNAVTTIVFRVEISRK